MNKRISSIILLLFFINPPLSWGLLSGKLIVYVYDYQTAEPISHAMLKTNSHASGLTDIAGYSSMRTLPGDCLLVIEKDGYKREETPISISPDEVIRIDIGLSRIEEQSGIKVSPVSLTINESDSPNTANFTISMLQAPMAEVRIDLAVSNTSEVSVSQNSVILNSQNWETGVEVIVIGKADGIKDGKQNIIIFTMATISDDPLFDGKETPDIYLTVMDNDPGLFLNSVMPNSGPAGQSMHVIAKGTGFDQQTTRVYLENTPDHNDYVQLVSNVVFYDSETLSLILPSRNEGSYNIMVEDDVEQEVLKDAVNYILSAEELAQKRRRAIIIAGGAPYYGNEIWKATQKMTEKAYLSLIKQGYKQDTIHFLSHVRVDVNDDKLMNDIDQEATYNAIDYAFNCWATNNEDETHSGHPHQRIDPEMGDISGSFNEYFIFPSEPVHELLIYLVDHGENGSFILNVTPDAPHVPDEDKTISAQVIDGWLDSLQQNSQDLERVIVIYDACFAGSFLPLMTPPPGKERIVVVSSKATEDAYFTDEGEQSFSRYFFDSVKNSGNLLSSFNNGLNFMQTKQTPLLDCDGDGDSDSEDIHAASEIKIGMGWAAGGSDPPNIGAPIIETMGTNARKFTVPVSRGAGGITLSRVWIEFVKPDTCDKTGSNVVAYIPVLDLRRKIPGDDSVWEGTSEDLTLMGEYELAFKAEDEENNCADPPITRTITVNNGWTCEKGDIDGIDGVTLTDAIIALKVTAGYTTILIRKDYTRYDIDVNPDPVLGNKVGIEETVYIFQIIAGLRNQEI